MVRFSRSFVVIKPQKIKTYTCLRPVCLDRERIYAAQPTHAARGQFSTYSLPLRQPMISTAPPQHICMADAVSPVSTPPRRAQPSCVNICRCPSAIIEVYVFLKRRPAEGITQVETASLWYAADHQIMLAQAGKGITNALPLHGSIALHLPLNFCSSLPQKQQSSPAALHLPLTCMHLVNQ